MKKVFSVLLSMILLLSCFSVTLSARAEEIPTVYISGYGAPILYNADGEQIYPVTNPYNRSEAINWASYLGLDNGVDFADLIQRVKASIAGEEDALTEEEESSLFVRLCVSFLTESKAEYAELFCETIGAPYEGIALDKDGNCTNGSGIRLDGEYVVYDTCDCKRVCETPRAFYLPNNQYWYHIRILL